MPHFHTNMLLKEKLIIFATAYFFLKQFTEGCPRDLVHSCQYMDPKRGYIDVKRLLQTLETMLISAACLEKALGWNAIKNRRQESIE